MIQYQIECDMCKFSFVEDIPKKEGYLENLTERLKRNTWTVNPDGTLMCPKCLRSLRGTRD